VSLTADSGAGLHLPRAGYQRVVYDNKTTAAVVLDLDHPVNVIDDTPNDANLESSSMIDHQSAAVRELLDRALPDSDVEMTDVQQATHLRAFVYDYIDEKDLSVGLASAGEVAQTAQGDCTEHAVLLAALLRAQGIPSRTVSGLLYVDQFLGQPGVFGYHMWTQAWLTEGAGGETGEKSGRGRKTGGGGRWVDLDAVLDGVDFDASHILLSVSSMRDGQMVNDMIEMLPMFGRLEVKVIEVE
jgi:transglutaminase-like putative cysteine protease